MEQRVRVPRIGRSAVCVVDPGHPLLLAVKAEPEEQNNGPDKKGELDIDSPVQQPLQVHNHGSAERGGQSLEAARLGPLPPQGDTHP